MWKFIKSAPDKTSWLETNNLQVCLWGRSNVGKSSLLNALTGQNISFVSKTPGRTQLINYFEDNNGKLIVDFPGYGYANISKEKQAKMLNNIKSFLLDIKSKKHLILLIDSRTGITQTDKETIDFLQNVIWPIDIVYTKIDKLNQSEKSKLIKKHNELVDNNYLSFINNVFFVSSLKKYNMEKLSEYIAKILYEEKNEKI
ncbi:GTP-binding protein EngB [Mycoplasmopsis meleagridis]|uniref:Probable GTP-binding protein EngB n=1 Tax=Mycoplasmopsis meleagridis ATCC 25294 TaxID=1264554 RepID=A0A0F5H083_9BACT|nr:ribosome biogenesis GTP-binding protein YihA/YsxC [Mycoplasmopsis meleagridis]KKB26731.1 GTP-binding protein EngB [Mycoplasmopsis meleagridis ATCC 25294]OAD18153.1 GTP-binding protein EngB [Mycoplasmopsis meleagridis]VEU77265.1 ribosome biogenesis GTP-binding protein YsxC [Mycoplasmopsis meleagridis]